VVTPVEPVVALCVVLPPLGVVRVNVTLAPETGLPPLVTCTVMGTEPGGMKLVPETEVFAASVGGVITVALAVSDALEDVDAAFRLTA